MKRFAVALFAIFLAACGAEPEQFQTPDVKDALSPSYGGVRVVAAGIGDVPATSARIKAWDSNPWVELFVPYDHGVRMLRAEFDVGHIGSMYLGELAKVVHCVGPEIDTWVADGHSDDVAASKYAGENLVVEFSGEFPGVERSGFFILAKD